ncbi:MAG TPA: CARDB domain-containing protein, partial [Vitreimonas sp.]|nr:CARDB domain-containing protein [Vitreimonas sp.]
MSARRRPISIGLTTALVASLLPLTSTTAHPPTVAGEPAPHHGEPFHPQPHARTFFPYRLAAPQNPELALATVAPRSNVELVGGSNGFTGGHVAVEGDRLYVGSYGVGYRIFDLANPANPTLLGVWSAASDSNAIPGPRADAVPDAAVFDGRHIAILNGTSRTSRSLPEGTGRTDNTEFIDATDPAAPRLLWTFTGANDGEAHNGDILDAKRLWLPSGGRVDNGLRIYDLNPLLGDTPQAPARIFPSDECRTSAAVMCDPVTLWASSPYRGDKPVGPAFDHTHDITIYPDYEVRQPDGTTRKRDIVLLAEGGPYTADGTNNGSMFVIDITDPRNPVVLLRWLHETGAGHHPIRYHHEAQFVDGLKNVVLVTDEDLHNGCGGAGGITAVRLSDDLTEATELSEWFIPFGTPAAVCSVHVMSSWRNFVFLGSYNAGLQIVDYADPENPTQAGYYIAEGSTAWGALVHEGYVYVGDMSRGLDVFRFTPPLPDLTLASGDISMTTERVNGADRVTIRATVRNVGRADARDVAVRFTDNGRQIGEVQTIAAIPAGGNGTASVVWDTKGLRGERTVAVAADPADAIWESDETNNTASTTVEVRGNKVRNGNFEASSTGSSPDHWSGSGSTSYDGHAASAGPGGAWVSAPIEVAPGTRLEFSVASTGVAGTTVVEQLS